MNYWLWGFALQCTMASTIFCADSVPIEVMSIKTGALRTIELQNHHSMDTFRNNVAHAFGIHGNNVELITIGFRRPQNVPLKAVTTREDLLAAVQENEPICLNMY